MHRARGDELLVAAVQAFTQDVQDADSAAAQGEGILGAGGRLIDGEHAGDGVQLVRDGYDAAGDTLGELVACEARAVVVTDGGSNLVALPCGLSIVAAHDALLACELDDRGAHEISFGQMRSALGIRCGMGADMRGARDGESEILHALGLLKHGAELLLEVHLGKALAEVLERHLEILIIEELGVIQTGADDALVAVDDGGGVLGAAVADHDELAGQLALGVVDGEIALVGEHRLADDLVRDMQELLVERAHEDGRPLAEVHDLIEDLLGRVDMRTCALGLDLGDALGDHLAAALLGKHPCRLKDLLVDGGLGDRVLTGCQHAVAARGVAGLDVGIAHGNDVAAQQGADPADRAHEGLVRGAPALAAVVGPLEVCDRVVEERGQKRHGGSGRNVLLGEHVFATVGVLAADEVGGGDAALARKALGCLGGVAVGIEGDVGGGAALHVVDGFGLGRHGRQDGQAARGRKHADLAVGKAGSIKAIGDELGQLLHSIHKGRGGHLLRADLEQNVTGLGHLRQPPLPWWCRRRPRPYRPRSRPWRRCGRAGCSWRARRRRGLRGHRGC